ncbi:HDIG domain-containing metalloprotein [Anaerovorax odorimutans]|uniref:HDIG domain-containing metalloprotein n=1 Tax=Anaerovorax odorimutans TaxID=109327 RepID=UPI000418EFEC|nr:HDIG domain-containing metalloprotein [Anaerovorax odorimutans]
MIINNNELFFEINKHLVNDKTPSKYINLICEKPFFKKKPFDLLYNLKRTGQSPKHHPEGNVWNHTMLVIDEAAEIKYKSKNIKVFMWAALLHDIGKPDTTKIRKGRITSYDHDKKGAILAGDFLKALIDDDKFIKEVTALIRWHMQILFVVNDLPFADIHAMKKQSDINEVALLGLCDRLGRLNVDKEIEQKNISAFIKKCNNFI